MIAPRRAPELADELTHLVTGVLCDLEHRYLPGYRIPGTFGGHRVEPDAAADLIFTLGWLERSGVTKVAGHGVTEVIRRLLGTIDGANTHTFFSYRVAETLAIWGPFEDNEILEGFTADQRANVAEACDSTSWIELIDQGLPRNYAAVLARCELARESLGLDVDAATLDALVDRTIAQLSANPRGFLDDSTAGAGRYDIYTADVWLFTEPLAGRLAGLWERGVTVALDLVDLAGAPDGSAVTWGRSTGALSRALTIELAALALRREDVSRQERWLRRANESVTGMATWFHGGLINAHQHRSPYDYRGPFRRLQMTLDVLGKLAWSAHHLAGVSHAIEPATYRSTFPFTEELVRFEDARASSLWLARTPGVEMVIPFVGATRSDYLAAPRLPGLYEVPVDTAIACWVPLVVDRRRTWTAAGTPHSVKAFGHGVEATWQQLAPLGELDPPADSPSLPGRCRAAWKLDGRSVTFDLELELDVAPQAITVLVPEVTDRELAVDVEGYSGDGSAHLACVDVAGMKEWRSFWSTFQAVHQVDLDPRRKQALLLRVTPKLRVASTAFGHPYDRSLYGPISHRVSERSPWFLPSAVRTLPLEHTDLFHLHWPEWIAAADLDVHRSLIGALKERRVPIVWTAHNLTPHLKAPELYDAIYQLRATAVDAVIHHSRSGEGAMRRRYRFPGTTRHEVIAHGHFGDLYEGVERMTKAELEAQLGLSPAKIRIGIFGAPRQEKKVIEFLEGVAASRRDDIQVVCWSLAPGQVAPDDQRIAVAEEYRMIDVATYAKRLAACDLVALPFDPDGEMLATGLVADVVGMGLGAMVSEWPYLAETIGDGSIACGHTAESVARAIDALTDEQIAASQRSSRARQTELAWPGLAATTFQLFEDVVLNAAASRSD